MSRKKRKFEQNLHPADGHLSNMKFKDLKRECVVRGMVFQDVVNSSIQLLTYYFREHFYDDINHARLDEFDDWQEQQIKLAMDKKGEDPDDVIHPALRLGYISERDDKGNVTKRKRVRTIVRKKKKKRERTEQGIFTGTKKALAFQLQKDGNNKATVIKMVIEAFPDASPKSIGIWFNKAKKI